MAVLGYDDVSSSEVISVVNLRKSKDISRFGNGRSGNFLLVILIESGWLSCEWNLSLRNNGYPISVKSSMNEMVQVKIFTERAAITNFSCYSSTRLSEARNEPDCYITIDNDRVGSRGATSLSKALLIFKNNIYLLYLVSIRWNFVPIIPWYH